jgi:hypothetical protein
VRLSFFGQGVKFSILAGLLQGAEFPTFRRVHIGIKAMPSLLLGAQKLDETSQKFWLVCVLSKSINWGKNKLTYSD